MKKTLKKFIPETLLKVIRNNRYGYFGPYDSWQNVKDKTTGYDDGSILKKVEEATELVKSGRAVFERDSVIFDKIQYSWPVLSGLLLSAMNNNNELSLIDFGGSLGSSYFQNKNILIDLKSIRWNVVEQATFVEVGKKNFEDNSLRFFHNIDECMKTEKPTTILLSSVVQYMEKPYEILRDIAGRGFKFIIIDRTIFSKDDTDFVTLQIVPPQVYRASYPCWFFNEKRFKEIFMKNYELLADFEALGGDIEQKNLRAVHKGFIYRKK